MKIEALNASRQSDFTAALANIFEHSPWVPERAWHKRPFAGIDELHAAMSAEAGNAALDEQLRLLRAHPELAGQEAQAGTLTRASNGEQTAAQLNQLSAEEMAAMSRLNRTYGEKFGFPFIIAVRNYNKHSIFAEFARRVSHAPDIERRAALEQVSMIARFRLEDLMDA